MIAGILLFSIAVFAGSFLITKNHAAMERSELALYIVLVAWGALLFGIFVSNAGAVPVR